MSAIPRDRADPENNSRQKISKNDFTQQSSLKHKAIGKRKLKGRALSGKTERGI